MSKQKTTMLIIGIIFVLQSILVWLGAWNEAAWLNWVIFVVGVLLIVASAMGKKNAAPAMDQPAAQPEMPQSQPEMPSQNEGQDKME